MSRDTKPSDKIYRCALIYRSEVVDVDEEYDEYRIAYQGAMDHMKADIKIVSVLIYSNKDSAIVLKRKWAKNG